MVLAIVLLLALGIGAVGHIQGWFDADNGDAARLTNIRGIVRLARDGAAFDVKEDTVLRDSDTVTCVMGATADVLIGDTTITLGENGQLRVLSPEASDFQLLAGEAFVRARDTVSITLDQTPLTFSDAAAALSVRAGAWSVSVFSGKVDDAAAGQKIEQVGTQRAIQTLSIDSLNNFTIQALRAAQEDWAMCFTNADLDDLAARRQAETQALLQQGTQTLPAEHSQPTTPTEEGTLPTETAPDSTTPTDTVAPSSEPTQPEATTPTTDTTPTTEPTDHTQPGTHPTTPTEPRPQTQETQPQTQTEPPRQTEPTQPPTEPPTEAPTQPPEPERFCTLTIRCDTILSNMDNLNPAKAGYVPSDGYILYPTEIPLEEGDTAFDVLQRACDTCGIQLEYSWTPMYNSYYVEGIGNLYEFDCGSQSGWMYKVNGWFPNYGCSSYTLSEGDNIVFCYTCNGLGADVGGGV